RAASFSSIDALSERFDSGEPMVVVFVPTYADPQGLARIEQLSRTRPELGSILVAEEISTQLLQQSLRAGVRDVVASPSEPAQLLQSLLVRHELRGVWVLRALLEHVFADQVSATDTAKIVQVLKGFAAYVVIDTPAQFIDVVLNLLEHSDDILMIAGMDIPNI